jgi:hypothetical protein
VPVKKRGKRHAELSASNKTCAEFISVSRTYETLKRPMKQVQGMVQGDISGLFTRPSVFGFMDTCSRRNDTTKDERIQFKMLTLQFATASERK